MMRQPLVNPVTIRPDSHALAAYCLPSGDHHTSPKGTHVKRFVATIATTGLLATAFGIGMMQPAQAIGDLPVDIHSAGTKKALVTWEDGTSFASASFDAYLVTLDNEIDTPPEDASRIKFVPTASERSVTFTDLSSNTTYHTSVYAVDYTDTGYTIVPATDQDPAGDALGRATGDDTPMTLKASKAIVLTDTSVTISGTVSDAEAYPATVHLLWDEYPQFGGTVEDTVQTDGNGNWSYAIPSLTESTWFFAEHRAEADSVGGWTGRTLVEVRKRISASVSPGLRVRAGTEVTFSGKVGGNPSYLDDGAHPANACLQKLEGGSWSKRFCKPINTLTGNYSLTFQPGSNAGGKYRVFSGMGPAYADSWSRTKKLVIT